MKVQILNPIREVFNGEVDSISVPGKNGAFKILNNHAAIVSTLKKGMIIMHTHSQEKADFDNISAEIEYAPSDDNTLQYSITGGVIEFNKNKAIILVD